jgi:large subunit ribosomal protein L24
MKIKRGDTVKILYGKDAGKSGKVLSVSYTKSQVVVEGLNMFKKHIKGDGQTKKSAVIDVIRPMPVSKVMLLCPHCGKSARVGMKLEGKNFVRVCKKCGKGVDTKVEKKEVEKKAESKTKKVSKK